MKVGKYKILPEVGTIASRRLDRETIAEQTRKFIEQGGGITVVPNSQQTPCTYCGAPSELVAFNQDGSAYCSHRCRKDDRLVKSATLAEA